MGEKSDDPGDPARAVPPDLADPGLDVDGVIDRLRLAVGAKNDTQLAKVLGRSKKTVSGWRARKAVPYFDILKASLNTQYTMEYIITGDVEAQLRRIGIGYDTGGSERRPRNHTLDHELIRILLHNVLRGDQQLFGPLDEEEIEELSRRLASQIAFNYNEYVAARDRLLEAGKSRKEINDLLLRAGSLQEATDFILREREVRRSSR